MSFAQQKELDKDSRQGIIVNPVSKLFTVFQAYAILTSCILVDSLTVVCWTSPFVILSVHCLLCRFNSILDGKSC